MRVHQITCPKCHSTLKSSAGVPVGHLLACPKCKHKFAVQEPDEADVIDDADVIEDVEEEDRPAPRKKSPPPPAARKREVSRRDDDEDEDEDEPRPKKRKPAGAMKSRSRDRDDEEDDERPRKKKKKRPRDDDEKENLYWRLRHNIAVRIAVWVVLLTVLAVAGYLLYQKQMREAADQDSRLLNSPSYVRVVPVGLDRNAEPG